MLFATEICYHISSYPSVKIFSIFFSWQYRCLLHFEQRDNLLQLWVNWEKYTQTMHHYQPGWTQKNIHRQCITINLGELRKIYTDNASLSTWVNSEKYTQTMHHYQPGWTQKNIHRQCITINLGELRNIYTENVSLSTWVNSEKYTQTMHHYQPGWTQKNIHRKCITINLGELRKIYTDNASLSTWVNSEKYTQTMHHYQLGWTHVHMHEIYISEFTQVDSDALSVYIFLSSPRLIVMHCLCYTQTMHHYQPGWTQKNIHRQCITINLGELRKIYTYNASLST
jgi:hypothetical protein